MQLATPIYRVERDTPPLPDPRNAILRELMSTVETACGLNFEWLFDRLETPSE